MIRILKFAAFLCAFCGVSGIGLAQNHNVVASVGYGFPSILRFALGQANIDTTTGYFKLQNIGGYGPVHGKSEYVFRNRIGIGASCVFNRLQVNYSNKFYDTFVLSVNESVYGLRLNGYFINNARHQLYLGAGIGYINFFNEVVRTSNPTDTFNQRFSPITSFQDHKSYELTLGYRGYVTKHIGAYAEIGSGKIMSQFVRHGFVDSWVQAGISYRFGNYKKVRFLPPPRKKEKKENPPKPAATMPQ